MRTFFIRSQGVCLCPVIFFFFVAVCSSCLSLSEKGQTSASLRTGTSNKASSGAGDKATGSTGRKDRIAVTVNGVDITEAQIERLVSPELERRLQAWLDSSPESIEQERMRLRQKILKELIEAQLIDEKVKEAGVVISDQDVEKALRESASKKGMSVEQQRAEVEASGRECDKVKQKIREELARQKVAELNVTEEDARGYYEKNITKYTDASVRASQILIRPDLEGADYNREKAWEIALAQANDILRQLRQGADFGELAQAYSQSSMGDPNGDLGFIPRGRFIPPFDRALFELKVGQISGLVKTPFGILILKATDRKEQVRPFEDVRNDVMRQAYLDRLKAEAEIVYPPLPSRQPENKQAAEIRPWAIFDHEQAVDWTAVRSERIGGMDWRVLPTEKFEVYFRKGSEPLIKGCIVQLDNVFRFMEYYFPEHDIKNKIRLIASPDLETHRKMQSVLHADGCYDAPRMDTRGRVPQIFISSISWCIPIIMHETTHVFYYRSGYTGANRNWDFVGEWLCGYFQEKYSDRPKYKFDEDTLAKIAMRRYLKEHPEFSLEDLKEGKEGVSDPGAFEQTIACFYSFLEEKYGSPRFRRFLWLLLEEEDLDIVAERVYSKTLTELNREWRDYFGLPPSELISRHTKSSRALTNRPLIAKRYLDLITGWITELGL
ncbi:MAG: peptidylprolyl isomerase [Phycisphaerae bacterium]